MKVHKKISEKKNVSSVAQCSNAESSVWHLPKANLLFMALQRPSNLSFRHCTRVSIFTFGSPTLYKSRDYCFLTRFMMMICIICITSLNTCVACLLSTSGIQPIQFATDQELRYINQSSVMKCQTWAIRL